MPEVVTDPFLTTEQAEAYLGLGSRTLEVARARGDGRYPPFYRVGGRLIKYRRSDLEEWLQKNKQQYPLNQAA